MFAKWPNLSTVKSYYSKRSSETSFERNILRINMYKSSIFFLEFELKAAQEIIPFYITIYHFFCIHKVYKTHLFRNENTYLMSEDEQVT